MSRQPLKRTQCEWRLTARATKAPTLMLSRIGSTQSAAIRCVIARLYATTITTGGHRIMHFTCAELCHWRTRPCTTPAACQARQSCCCDLFILDLCSSDVLPDHEGCCEVNCLNMPTPWRVQLFLQYNETDPNVLKSVRSTVSFSDCVNMLHCRAMSCVYSTRKNKHFLPSIVYELQRVERVVSNGSLFVV